MGNPAQVDLDDLVHCFVPMFGNFLILEPVADAFRITGVEGNVTLKLLDMNGRLLLTKQVTDNDQISVNSLPQGLYIVKLITANGTVEQKMMKK